MTTLQTKKNQTRVKNENNLANLEKIEYERILQLIMSVRKDRWNVLWQEMQVNG